MKLERRKGLGSGRKPRDEEEAEATEVEGAAVFADLGKRWNRRRERRGWPSRPSRLRWRWLRLLFVVVACFGLGYYVAAAWLFPGSEPEELPVVEVPELQQRSLEEAEGELRPLGLTVVPRGRIAHPTVEEGRIVAQSPLAGQFAARRGTVYVTRSRGSGLRTMPDLTGVSARHAEAVLEHMGLQVETRIVESRTTRGGVQGSDPPPGQAVEPSTVVQLLIGEGPQVAVVPDLRGRHVADLEELLNEAGLQLGSVQFAPDAPEAPGRVVAQFPPPGYSLRGGASVSVEVAGRAGEVEIPTPEPEPSVRDTSASGDGVEDQLDGEGI